MWRSKCNGTLAERVNELERELAPSRELLLKGRMPGPECFRGDAYDVGKLYALKQTAMRIKELESRGGLDKKEQAELRRLKQDEMCEMLGKGC